MAYGIEICSHLQVGHVAEETAAPLVPVVHLSRASERQVLHIIGRPDFYYRPFGDGVLLIVRFNLTLELFPQFERM